MKHHRAGFTLVELIIYIAIVGLTVSALLTFVTAVSQSRSKTYVAQEVNANLRHALERIEREVRRANGIYVASSTWDTDPGELWLSMQDSAENPTVFSLDADDGSLQITQGNGSPLLLTQPDVGIVSLQFTALATSSRESVRVMIDAAYQGEAEFSYTTTVTSSFTIRY